MTKITRQEAQQIAEEAYIYAYPMLENYQTMYIQAINPDLPTFLAPFNQFNHMTQLLGPEFKDVVSPNNDTLYSMAWLDLRVEPIVLSVPAIAKERYFSFQMIDMFTHNFAYVGSRATGFEAGHYLIAGPDWQGEKPEGIDQVLQSESNFILNLGRTQVNGKADLANVIAIQSQYQLTPLSKYLHQPTPDRPPEITFPLYTEKDATTSGFISIFNFLLGQVKLPPEEKELTEKFEAIGICTECSPEIHNTNVAVGLAIEEGVSAGLEKITNATQTLGERRNGWQMTTGIFGNRQEMQGQYLKRAAAGMIGLYGNTHYEAFYPIGFVDSDGEQLGASKHEYRLHFAKDEMPPVKGFWSVSMYKLPEKLFVANAIQRYSIGDRTPGLLYNQDGSLTIYIQHESPGGSKEANWLPAPDGVFYLVLRLYWPKEEAFDGQWAPPAIKKAE